MKPAKRNVIDPFPSPKWLVPQKHPEAFRRQALQVRFRWPGIVGWVALAASFAAAILLGWAWLPLIPFILMVMWSGILTNKGKPFRGFILLMVALLGVNIAVVAAVITVMLMFSLGGGAGAA